MIPSPVVFRQTLSPLLLSRRLPAVASRANAATSYKPLSRTFIQTAKMSGTPGKKGVHNLESKKDFDAALDEKGSLMVLDCYATWCGPCKVMAPRVVELSDKHPEARFYKLDVDEVPDVAQELGIRAMPTFLVFKNGEKLEEVVGANFNALQAAVANHV